MLAVLLALGLDALRPRALGRAWIALVLAVSAYACVRYDTDVTKEPWRAVVRWVDGHRTPAEAGGTAVLVTFDDDPFRFYDTKLAAPLEVFEISHPDVPFASRYTPAQLDEMETAARERTAPYADVWVVVRSPNSEVRREAARRALRAAADGRRPAGHWVWRSTGGPLRVWRYRRAAG